MMTINEVKFNETTIHTVNENGETFFSAYDLCGLLGLQTSNVNKQIIHELESSQWTKVLNRWNAGAKRSSRPFINKMAAIEFVRRYGDKNPFLIRNFIVWIEDLDKIVEAQPQPQEDYFQPMDELSIMESMIDSLREKAAEKLLAPFLVDVRMIGELLDPYQAPRTQFLALAKKKASELNMPTKDFLRAFYKKFGELHGLDIHKEKSEYPGLTSVDTLAQMGLLISAIYMIKKDNVEVC